MQKTLGGDRLGSGKKMKVNLHAYERSTHDLSYLWRSTMSAGTLVPFMSKVALPGDTWDIKLNCEIMTHPTIGPLFGSYKVQLDIFVAPMRLYQALLHNNMLGIGLRMEDVMLPVIDITAKVNTTPEDTPDLDNSQINPSCILSYLGIRGIGMVNSGVIDVARDFNAIPLLAYWEIYKNYYANKQEEIGAVIHTPQIAVVDTVDTISIGGDVLPQAPTPGSVLVTGTEPIVIEYTGTPPNPTQIMLNTVEHGLQSVNALFGGIIDTGTQLQGNFVFGAWGNTNIINWDYINNTTPTDNKPQVVTFGLANIDTMRQDLLAVSTPGAKYNINGAGGGGGLEPYIWLTGNEDIPNILSSQEGLGIKTYQSDLLNNWLQTEWIDGTTGINAITAIDTSSGEFTIDTLILAQKVYDMLNRIAVSGGSYYDWIDAVYTEVKYRRCESPMYMGGLIRELVFQEVVSNSQSSDQPLGTLAGKGIMSQKKKGGYININIDEPSYIIGIISLTPRIDYSQGNSWDVNLQSINDLHKPALDEIGFQELITEQMAWWDTTWDNVESKWVQKSAGKQPAWANYMTSLNETRGNFAITTNEMFMTLNRRYEFEADTIKDLTTYIDPSKFNFIFAQTALDAQNFWSQIALDITTRRKMSAKVMPNL